MLELDPAKNREAVRNTLASKRALLSGEGIPLDVRRRYDALRERVANGNKG
jgi:hypothetical protein